MAGKKLVVVVGGWVGARQHTQTLESAVREAYAGQAIKVFVPETGFSKTGRGLLDLTASIIRQVSKEWCEGDYSKIVLVGFSMGAVVTRKMWMAAMWTCLGSPRKPEDPEPEGFLEKEIQEAAVTGIPWADKVERIVLIGSLDLGWHITHHFRPMQAVVVWLMGLVLRPLSAWIPFPVLEIERGTPYIENLRIQWARLLHRMKGRDIEGPIFVQMFGTQDNFVGPMEAVDPLFLAPPHCKDPSELAGRYLCIEVPDSRHEELVNMEKADGPKSEKRRYLFIEALRRKRDDFGDIAAHLAEESEICRPEPEVTDVVFVIHGIRDTGYWTMHLAQRIKAKAGFSRESKLRFVSETSTYGYFAMLPFITSQTRRKKVQWLFDQYAENAASFPNATFHFVGHSNGTFLLASAMERSPCIRFANVAFAGSVVRRDFPWRLLKSRGQVRRVANYLATCDWVVAVFPWFIGKVQRAKDIVRRLLGLKSERDLGAASDLGFSDCRGPDGDLMNLGPVKGGHGAAIEERNWDFIASFILGGAANACETSQRRSISLVAWRLTFAALAMLLGIGLYREWPWLEGLPNWKHGLGYLAAVVSLRTIVTKV